MLPIIDIHILGKTFDPDVVDMAFYLTLALLSLEPISWWMRAASAMPSPKPRILYVSIVQQIVVLISAVTLLAISYFVFARFSGYNNYYWNPILRRVLGVCLFFTIATHWYWRKHEHTT